MKADPQAIEMNSYDPPNQHMHSGPIDDMKPRAMPRDNLQSPAMLYRSHTSQSLSKEQQLRRVGPQQGYCRKLCCLWSQNRLFLFYEIITGNMVKHFFRKIGLGCMAGDSIIETIIEWLQRVVTPRWLPLVLRPFLTGAFFPIMLFFWLDFRYLKDQSKDSSPLSDLEQNLMVISFFVTMCLFILAGVKDSGSLDQPSMRQRSNDIIRAKPYLRGSDHYCSDCDMIKPLRAKHCHRCGICVSKYSKHSILLNKCIGASNQLMYLLMIAAALWSVSVVLDVFVFQPLKGWLVIKIVFYFVNAHMQLQLAADALEGLIFNTMYNCTKHEIENWESIDYLSPETVFNNPNDLGFFNNLGESLINMTCGGRFEPHQLNFLEIAKQPVSRKPISINWTYSLMFHPSQIPNNKNRQMLAEAAYIVETNLLGEPKNKDILKNRKSVPERSKSASNKKTQENDNRHYQSDSVNKNKPDENMPNHQMIEDEHD